MTSLWRVFHTYCLRQHSAAGHQHSLPAMCLAASAVPAPMLRATTRPRRFQANQRRGLEETNYGGEAKRCSDWSLASNEM